MFFFSCVFTGRMIHVKGFPTLSRVAKFGWLGLPVVYMDCPSVCLWIMLEEHSGKQRTTFNVWYMFQPKVKLLQSLWNKDVLDDPETPAAVFFCCVQIRSGGLTLLTAGFHVTFFFFCLRNLLGSGPGNLGELAQNMMPGSIDRMPKRKGLNKQSPQKIVSFPGEPWKIPWLVGLYRGLYYPVIWGF